MRIQCMHYEGSPGSGLGMELPGHAGIWREVVCTEEEIFPEVFGCYEGRLSEAVGLNG